MGLSDIELAAIQARCDAAPAGEWRAWVEGRDHTSGDSFVETGVGATERGPDVYVSVGSIPAPAELLGFIAHARQDLPMLIAEVRHLQALLHGRR